MTARRGAVLIESALTLTVVLFVLYGTLQLGIVGLGQISVDGGAFTMAHQQSFAGGKQTYSPAFPLAQTALPHLNSPNVSATSQVGEAPTTAFLGQYGFNTPNARYGGVSLIQPIQTIATITKSKIDSIVFGFLGSQTLSVTGTAIEPTYRLINSHFDVAGQSFNSTGAFNTNADPFSESAPPYFVGFTYLQACPYELPGNSAPGWVTCPKPGSLRAVGSAAYLDDRNWGRPTNGVTPSPTAVFWETRYHQTLFAQISGSLVGLTTAQKQAVLDPLGRAAAAKDVRCVYQFDNFSSGAYPAGYSGPGLAVFALHPDYTDAQCVAP